MLVEFLGTTGAGKTTVASAIQKRLQDCGAVTASDLVTGLAGLRRVRNPTIRNLVQEALAVLPFAARLGTHARFVQCACRSLVSVRPWLAAACCARAVERALGVDAICRRRASEIVVLVDEGPILAAHALLLAAATTGHAEVRGFAAAMPWPDVCVWVRAASGTVAARTLERPDAPRGLRGASVRDIRLHVEWADALYERLLEGAPEGRVVVVNNTDAASGALEEEADKLADRIRLQFTRTCAARAEPAVLLL